MEQSKPHAAFMNYLAAFTTTSPAEREALLRSSVADTIAFSNPGVDGAGIDNLLTHIAWFQEHFPSGGFRVNWLRQQHGHLLAEWTQLSEDGSELVTAHSYARTNQDGRIVQFSGFWENF